MLRHARRFCVRVAVSILLSAPLLLPGNLHASRSRVDENDVTARLFQLLDSANGGQLDDVFILADIYTNSSGAEYRHVLRLDYDKSRAFGRLKLYVRSVAKMTPEQLATYTPQQIYDFGEADEEKFVKTDPGTFGQKGDLYLHAMTDGPLHTEEITSQARQQYESFISQYVLPAVQKGH